MVKFLLIGALIYTNFTLTMVLPKKEMEAKFYQAQKNKLIKKYISLFEKLLRPGSESLFLGEKPQELILYNSKITAIDHSANHKFSIIAFEDGTLKLIDLSNINWQNNKENIQYNLPCPLGSVIAVKFSFDGSKALSISTTGAILWQLSESRFEDNKIIYEIIDLPEIGDDVSTISISSDLNIISLGYRNGTIKVINLEKECECIFKRHNSSVLNLHFYQNKYLLSTCAEKFAITDLCYLNWETKSLAPNFKNNDSRVDHAITSASFSSDGKYIISGHLDGSVRINDLKGSENIFNISFWESLMFHPIDVCLDHNVLLVLMNSECVRAISLLDGLEPKDNRSLYAFDAQGIKKISYSRKSGIFFLSDSNQTKILNLGNLWHIPNLSLEQLMLIIKLDKLSSEKIIGFYKKIKDKFKPEMQIYLLKFALKKLVRQNLINYSALCNENINLVEEYF